MSTLYSDLALFTSHFLKRRWH